MHSTNYANAFIEVADDCKTDMGTVPPEKREKTVARMQLDMLFNNPYRYTSDEVLFTIYAERNGIADTEREAGWQAFFSKGQACLRSSPLGKTYGWGIHFDDEARIAIYARGTEAYDQLKDDPSLKHLKAMRSSR